MIESAKALTSEEFNEICRSFFGHEVEVPQQQTASDVDLDKLLNITRNNTLTMSALSQQMGFVANKVADDSVRIDSLEHRIGVHERTVTLTNYQTKEMYQAVHNRVAELLRGDGGHSPYFGRFCSKLWRDAKKRSKMAQDYKFTLQIDFDEVMGYIGSWYPDGYSGVDAYKEHLDACRS